MSVAVRAVGAVRIVELAGEFTLGTVGITRPLDLHGRRLEDFGQTLLGLLEKGNTRIVLDMEKVRFMDSAGLGELVAWKKRAAQLGGDVRLLRLPSRLREVFTLMALDRVFRMFDAEADAVASFEP